MTDNEAVAHIQAILEAGKQKAAREKTDPRFAERSRMIEARQEKRVGRGKGEIYA